MAADSPFELGGGKEGYGAAHAETDDGGRTAFLRLVDGGLHVAHHCAPIGIGDELARVGDFVRRIAALEIRLLAIEQSRRYRSIAIGGETIADRADVMIDAKDFLDDDDAALGRLRSDRRDRRQA